jgi:hypothetical protein
MKIRFAILRLKNIRLKSIRSHQDECPLLDTTTAKLSLTTSPTIMNELENETWTQC